MEANGGERSDAPRSGHREADGFSDLSEGDFCDKELNKVVLEQFIDYITKDKEPSISGKNNLNSLHMVFGSGEKEYVFEITNNSMSYVWTNLLVADHLCFAHNLVSANN